MDFHFVAICESKNLMCYNENYAALTLSLKKPVTRSFNQRNFSSVQQPLMDEYQIDAEIH